MKWTEMERVMEAILFASGEPIGVERLCLAMDLDRPSVDAVARQLMDRYSFEQRGIRLLRLEHSYQLCSAPELAPQIRRALEGRKPAKLSPSALEVLAVIAYFQPITRAYVDQVRGVDSSYTVGLLLDRELIEECGRLAVPGRPMQFRTTATFLRSFGLSTLDDLPDLPNSSPENEESIQALQMTLEQIRLLQSETSEEVFAPLSQVEMEPEEGA